MSPTPITEFPSTTTTTTHTNHGKIFAAGDQLVATNISTGKKGLAGSVIAGAIIGGIVVTILIVALFFALRHRHRRSKGQTASTTEVVPDNENENENENEKEKYAEANESSSGHCPASVLAYPSAAVQRTQSDIVMCQSRPIPSPSNPQRSPDSSSTFPTHINYSNVTTHAPRPQSYQMCPCPSCVLSSAGTSTSTGANPPASSPRQEYQIYDIRSCVSSTSPPLPPGAMPPISSPTLESYQEQFRTSPPPQSPSSPGGSSLRRWIMSPLSRSGTARTALPPYEQPTSENYRVSDKKDEDKKDESALAASVYTFM
ncbi:unnamed protein product [Rhizoctonia solani]|uniref:Uncharacterized protein n=1 Tax=Rhizoctonia solani TaxID=456999 RepID=A0A8H3A9U3_9AGAM|nr:unnamed protein product [Rhizoctonia solani]CAE6527996.1 unnamed protein product [Rhizoctonia solani]